ncbi:hypothetical protein GBA52_028918 [Prunus armeniaca]|nr:hypothetical protein GBA52_028918 [Prunus armeniaca]
MSEKLREAQCHVTVQAHCAMAVEKKAITLNLEESIVKIIQVSESAISMEVMNVEERKTLSTKGMVMNMEESMTPTITAQVVMKREESLTPSMEGKATVTNAEERETLTMEPIVNVEKPIEHATGMEVMNVEERETLQPWQQKQTRTTRHR